MELLKTSFISDKNISLLKRNLEKGLFPPHDRKSFLDVWTFWYFDMPGTNAYNIHFLIWDSKTSSWWRFSYPHHRSTTQRLTSSIQHVIHIGVKVAMIALSFFPSSMGSKLRAKSVFLYCSNIWTPRGTLSVKKSVLIIVGKNVSQYKESRLW